jgi:hypothetical protein
MKPTPRRVLWGRGRAALFWTVGLFVLTQALLGKWVLHRIPKLCNAAWEFRLTRLRARMAEAPGRPLLLVMGSSRVANGFSPSALGDWAPPDQPAPVVFNFATLGAGPVRQLLTLRRLLAEGIRPRWVVSEVWPGFWADMGRYAELEPILSGRLYVCDVPVLSKTYQHGCECLRRVCSQTLTPAVCYRTGVLFTFAPFLVPRCTEGNIKWDQVHWYTLDDWGWLPVRWAPLSPEKLAAHLEEARNDVGPIFRNVQPLPHMDWATRELIRTCRREGIALTLIFLPENSALRSWYPPAARAVVDGYLAQLEHDYGVPIVDARTWLDDHCFGDFCHLMPPGAEAFSARLGRDVLRPMVAGEPLPVNTGLRPFAVSSGPVRAGP